MMWNYQPLLQGGAQLQSGIQPFVADAGTFVLSGQAASIITPLAANVGSFTLSGQDVILGPIGLLADQGSFLLEGQSLSIIFVELEYGALSLSGQGAFFSIAGTQQLVSFGLFKQTITYWGSPVADGNGGLTYASPVQLNGRWEDKIEQVADEQGETFISHARVYTQQDLDIGGYLFNGNSAAVDPTTVNGSYKIRHFVSIPNLRNTRTMKKAML